MKTYDFHSHVIPETIVGAMRADPALYGTQIEEREGWRWLVREIRVAQGFTVLASPPEELARATRDQLERYAKVFKQAGIRAE